MRCSTFSSELGTRIAVSEYINSVPWKPSGSAALLSTSQLKRATLIVMVALTVEYEGEVVALSAGMAFLGCFTAVSLMEQYRLSTVQDPRNGSLVLMAFVAASLSGVAIWCLHFVASCSFRLLLEGVEIPLRFNVNLIICALVVNFIVQFISIYIASTDACFNKSKKEIMESFISRASTTYTMTQIRSIGKIKLLFLICTHNLYRVVIGGVFSGFGCALVIYLGLMSMEFQGTIKYNPGLIVLTIILATIFATNGFVTFVRVLSLFPSMDSLRLGIAFNSLFFMTGMHYIGLTSATFEYDSSMSPPSADTTISQHKLLLGTLAAAVLFCIFMQVFVVSDLRAWLLNTSTQLRQADIVIDGLYQYNNHHQQGRSPDRPAPAHSEMLRYVRRYNRFTPTASAASSVSDPAQAQEGVPYLRRFSLYNDYSDDDEATGSSSAYNYGSSDIHGRSGLSTPNTITRKKPAVKSMTESSSAGRSAVYLAPDDQDEPSRTNMEQNSSFQQSNNNINNNGTDNIDNNNDNNQDNTAEP